MPLKTLKCWKTPIKDLSPLAGMSLQLIIVTLKNITQGIEVLRPMNSLQQIGVNRSDDGYSPFPPFQFWKKYDAGELSGSR